MARACQQPLNPVLYCWHVNLHSELSTWQWYCFACVSALPCWRAGTAELFISVILLKVWYCGTYVSALPCWRADNAAHLYQHHLAQRLIIWTGNSKHIGLPTTTKQNNFIDQLRGNKRLSAKQLLFDRCKLWYRKLDLRNRHIGNLRIAYKILVAKTQCRRNKWQWLILEEIWNRYWGGLDSTYCV